MGNVTCIVLDSVGIGALPDAGQYGDEGAATLPHLFEAVAQVHLPHLESLGLGHIAPLKGFSVSAKIRGAYGKLASKTVGKDSVAGHWELMGVWLEKPLALFPNGFPPKLLKEFEVKTGYGWLGNIAMSLYVLAELFHLRTSAQLSEVITRRNPGRLPLPAALVAAAIGIYLLA